MIFRKTKVKELTLEHAAPEKIGNHSAIKRIWGNTELSREEFDLFYLPVLVDAITHAKDDFQKDHILRLTSGIMVARGGFRLGKSLPIEDSDRISNRFTLGLAACVLVEIIARRESEEKGLSNVTATALALLQPKLGDYAFNCLWQTPLIFNDVCAYFSGSKTSEIRAVITQYFTREDNAQYSYLLPSFAATETDKSRTINTIVMADAQGRKTSLAHQYIAWLNRMLSDNTLSINEVDSLAHLSDAGDLFLIEGLALHGFAGMIDKETKAISRSLAKQGFIKINQSTRNFYKGSVNGERVNGHLLTGAKAMLNSISNETPSEFLVLDI